MSTDDVDAGAVIVSEDVDGSPVFYYVLDRVDVADFAGNTTDFYCFTVLKTGERTVELFELIEFKTTHFSFPCTVFYLGK